MSPTNGPPWDGQDYGVFYGNPGANPFGGNVATRVQKQGRAEPVPAYPFTATMNTRPGMAVGPDSNLNTAPMSKLGITLATAATQNTPPELGYLRSGVVCGSCHVVLLPQVPTGYAAGKAIPPNYPRPVA